MMKGIRIRPEMKGLKAALFDLEAEIMDAVWSDHWLDFSVGDVLVVLEKRREIAYTTVMTTVHRLHEKGLLERKRAGRRHVYQATMSREEFNLTMARNVLESLPDEGHLAALALLVDRVGEADLDELEQLELLIAARRRELVP